VRENTTFSTSSRKREISTSFFDALGSSLTLGQYP